MKTPHDVFDWAESLMDSVEAITGGYQPFVSLDAREREHGTAERIIRALRRAEAADTEDQELVRKYGAAAILEGRREENERLRQEFEQVQTDAKWMSEGPTHTSPVSAAHEMGFKEAVSRLRAAVEAAP